MIETWPDTLPRPERETWQLTPQESRRKTTSDAGPPRYSRRFSLSAKVVTLSVVLDHDQRAVFDRFFHVDCANGSLLFRMPDPTVEDWPLMGSNGDPLLDATDVPLLLAGVWLCAWGDQLPAETVQGLEFKKTFAVVVMP